MNVRPFELAPILASIPPQSAGAGNVDSGWVDASLFEAIEAQVLTGVLGASATVDAKLQHASDSAGTGAEDITGKAITQIIKATGDNKIATISLLPQEMKGAALNINNGARWVRLRIAVGTAASLIGGSLRGFNQRMGQGTDLDAVAVVQNV